jgi:hypothetical protein
MLLPDAPPELFPFVTPIPPKPPAAEATPDIELVVPTAPVPVPLVPVAPGPTVMVYEPGKEVDVPETT